MFAHGADMTISGSTLKRSLLPRFSAGYRSSLTSSWTEAFFLSTCKYKFSMVYCVLCSQRLSPYIFFFCSQTSEKVPDYPSCSTFCVCHLTTFQILSFSSLYISTTCQWFFSLSIMISKILSVFIMYAHNPRIYYCFSIIPCTPHNSYKFLATL